MKFGETLYQRSVPQWSTYNFNYNEIKQLIKERTSVGRLATPVSIPTGSSKNRWDALEDELIVVLRDQYDNIALFLNSKYGEIERRLNFLEKQVRSARKAAQQPYTNQSLQGRRFHKLLVDAESLGEDIQNLTRFAAVQKTAFRKILKKYRKWTGSTTLQTRVENEVLATRKLNLDYARALERLAVQVEIINKQSSDPSRTGHSEDHIPERDDSPSSISASPVSDINNAEEEPIFLDAVLATIPFGKSSGFATYWIHPDNIDEARALLLRYVREIHRSSEDISRESSNLSLKSTRSGTQSSISHHDRTCITYFDNAQRFLQDDSRDSPSKIALSGRWCQTSDAAVTLSNLVSRNPSSTIVRLKRKEIFKALNNETASQHYNQKQTANTANVEQIQAYLSEHRDIQPLAQVCTLRSRYAGSGNSTETGVWAVLDSDVVFSPFHKDGVNSSEDEVESGNAFPHAILQIRWESCRKPEVVRTFDTTHLAEKVDDFSLESAAIHMVNPRLEAPLWKELLKEDIRKVPIVTHAPSATLGATGRGRRVVTGTSSGPSSSDGPADSVFSTQNTLSSTTSVPSPNPSTRDVSQTEESKSISKGRKKKRARIDAQSPPPRQTRYWNEFDDGDEDVNPQEAYMIYVDPNESFPGAETVSKAFGAMYKSLGKASSRVSSMLSLKSRPEKKKKKSKPSERSRLLRHTNTTNSDEGDSSDSDSTPTQEFPPKFGTFQRPHARARAYSNASLHRAGKLITPRQKALERSYFMFYSGLITLSYILLFVSGVLLAAGRRRDYVEVDIAVIAGIVTAGISATLSMILLWMRKMPLSILHVGVVQVAVVTVLIIGVAELAVLFTRSHH